MLAGSIPQTADTAALIAAVRPTAVATLSGRQHTVAVSQTFSAATDLPNTALASLCPHVKGT